MAVVRPQIYYLAAALLTYGEFGSGMIASVNALLYDSLICFRKALR